MHLNQAGPAVSSGGSVPAVDTAYGRMGTVICFDMDQPLLVRRAGLADTDIMLIPGLDWREIRFAHSQWTAFRAIENGFSVVRAAGEGWSAAFDPQGRVLATADTYATDEAAMVAYVPTRGVRTAYTVVGDLFAWLCMVGLVLLGGWAIMVRRDRGTDDG